MKVHKIELLFIDYGDFGAQAIKEEIENTSIANYYPTVMNIKTKIVKFPQDHEEGLDFRKKVYRELFPEK